MLFKAKEKDFKCLPIGTLMEVHYKNDDGHTEMVYARMHDFFSADEDCPPRLLVLVDQTSLSSVHRIIQKWEFDIDEIVGWRCIGPDFKSVALLHLLDHKGALCDVVLRVGVNEIYEGKFISYRQNEVCLFLQGTYKMFPVATVSELRLADGRDLPVDGGTTLTFAM